MDTGNHLWTVTLFSEYANSLTEILLQEWFFDTSSSMIVLGVNAAGGTYCNSVGGSVIQLYFSGHVISFMSVRLARSGAHAVWDLINYGANTHSPNPLQSYACARVSYPIVVPPLPGATDATGLLMFALDVVFSNSNGTVQSIVSTANFVNIQTGAIVLSVPNKIPYKSAYYDFEFAD